MAAPAQVTEQQRSLYRRHRPRTFGDVVGQEVVVRTLANAVERAKVHHAYLFVGSRGTGKTSMAKILAACLNCTRGPTVDPCGECESCVSIANASSLDVIEMDAASNNSVDDIRELRASVTYAPVSGRRKVYILDEAHMLSTAAWNAFLKTLEEPPPNTVFVLATTEAQKVPPTVVDRCHRFDFHRPSVEQISRVVRQTAAAESIEIPPEGVLALSRAASGSFRDALGTLEQLVTYSGSEISLADVLAVLGVADASLLEAAIDAIAAGDAAAALRTVERCVQEGRDPASFAADLEARARELLVVQALGELPAELSLTPEADAALRAQAERVPHATVLRLLELLGQVMEGVRAGADPRTRLELCLLKSARPELDASTGALLARIERLERGATGSVPEHADVSSRPRPAPAPAPAEGAGVASRAEGSGPASRPDDAGSAPHAEAHDPPGSHSGEPDAEGEEATATADREGAVAVARDPGGDLDSLRSLWPAVVDLVRAENALLGALIEEAEPVELSGQDLTIAFAASAPFLKKKAEDPLHRAAVAKALEELTGTRWLLSYELRGDDAPPGSAASAPGSEEEWVRRFVEEFDAEELPADDASSGRAAEAQQGGAGTAAERRGS